VPCSRLRRSRDGRILCDAHRTTGAPIYHHDGCDACAAAKAAGIIRPPASQVAPRRRRGRETPAAQNWGKWAIRPRAQVLTQSETSEEWLRRRAVARG